MSTQFARHTVKPHVAGVRVNHQREMIEGREADMAFNNAGGAVFVVSPFDHLLRFLILGTEGGTYYATEAKHTMQAFEGLKTCIKQDAKRTVDLAVEVSQAGRAPKNDPALFVIAAVMALGQPEEKHYARSQLSKVARIGTHLFHFAEFVDTLKGWGTGTRKAFQQWYLEKTPDQIAHQFIKYGQRDGWSHRDILRKAHPVGTETQNAVFSMIAHPEKIGEGINAGVVDFCPDILVGYHLIKEAKDEKSVLDLIKNYNLPREVIPTEYLNSKKVWEMLVPNMKPEALIRNLGKLTSIGLLAPMNDWTKLVISKITDPELLKRARIHPLNVYKAMKTYHAGRGIKGSLVWSPVMGIEDALEDGFYKSFGFVEPSGKNTLLALDVSGSMSSSMVHDVPKMTCREATAVMAMATAKVEPNYQFMAFSRTFMPLDISKSDNLAQVERKICGLPFSTTDCSLPMEYAAKNNINVDIFEIYTDNETYAGRVQPSQALQIYRNKMNKQRAKMAVVAFTASKFTIADPKDPFMVDFVGFDASAPQAMAELAKM